MRYTNRTIRVSIPYIQEAMASKEEFDALAFCLFVKLSITSSEIQNATVRHLKELTHMGSDRLKRVIDFCVKHCMVVIENGTHGRNLKADEDVYWANVDAFVLNNIGM